MSVKQTSNVYDVSFVLRCYFKLLGWFCFTIDADTLAAKVTGCDAALWVLNICAAVAMFVQLVHEYFDSDDMLFASYGLVDFCGCTAIVGSMLLTHWHRHRVADILCRIHRFDQLVQQHGVHIDHARHRRATVWFVVLTNAATMATRSIVTVAEILGCDYTWSSLLRGHIVEVLYNVQYANSLAGHFWSLALRRSRFEARNRLVCRVLARWRRQAAVKHNDHAVIEVLPASRASDNATADDAQMVRMLRSMNASLMAANAACNRCFSHIALAMTAMMLVKIIIASFAAYKLLADNAYRDLEFFIALNACYFALDCTWLLLVVAGGSGLRAAGRQTVALVHGALNDGGGLGGLGGRRTGGGSSREWRLFAQQLRHGLPAASCGLFRFDWALLLSVCDDVYDRYWLRLVMLIFGPFLDLGGLRNAFDHHDPDGSHDPGRRLE